MNAEHAVVRLEHTPVSRWHWKMFWVLGLALQSNGILNSSGNAVLADLVDKGWSDNYLNAFFSSAMMLGFFVGSLGAGIGDRIGRKSAYELSILLFGVMALVAACAPSMAFLIVCRGLMGVGMGAGIVLGYGTFTELIPAPVRGRWSARISLLGNLSPLIAAVLAAVLIPVATWRSVLVVGGALSLGMLVLVHRQLDESPRWLIKTGRTQEGVAIIDRITRQAGGAGPGSVPQQVPAAAAAQWAAALPQEDEVPLRSFFHGWLGRRTLVASATVVAMNLSLYTITQWVPTILVNQGIDIRQSLVMSMTMMVGAPLGVLISTLIMDRFPRRYLGAVLIVLVAVLGAVYANQTTHRAVLAWGFLMILVLYVYNSFASAVYAPELWPTAQKMRGLGIANAIGRVTAILSPYLVAWLLTELGVVAVFAVLGALLTVCALILLVAGIETAGVTVEAMSGPPPSRSETAGQTTPSTGAHRPSAHARRAS